MHLSQVDPTRLLVLPIGIGNAFTSRFYNSSFLILAGGLAILVDAPAPLGRVLREGTQAAGLDLTLGEIDHVFLTHLHGDHCNGLEEFGFLRHHVLGIPGPTLHLLPEVEHPLWDQRLRAAMQGRQQDRTLQSFFSVETLEEGQDYRLPTPSGCDIRFAIRRTIHSLPCFAFRLEFKGAILSYSADTSFDPALIEFLAPGNVIIHEAGEAPPHTAMAELVSLPESLRRRLLVTHVLDTFPFADSPISALQQGAVYDIAEGPTPWTSILRWRRA